MGLKNWWRRLIVKYIGCGKMRVEKAIACGRVQGNGKMALLPAEQNEDLNPGSKWRFKKPELWVWWLKWAGIKGIDNEVSPDSLKADNGGESVFAGVGVSYQSTKSPRALAVRPVWWRGDRTRAAEAQGQEEVEHFSVSTFGNCDCWKTSWEVESVMNFKQMENKRFLNF